MLFKQYVYKRDNHFLLVDLGVHFKNQLMTTALGITLCKPHLFYIEIRIPITANITFAIQNTALLSQKNSVMLNALCPIGTEFIFAAGNREHLNLAPRVLSSFLE